MKAKMHLVQTNRLSDPSGSAAEEEQEVKKKEGTVTTLNHGAVSHHNYWFFRLPPLPVGESYIPESVCPPCYLDFCFVLFVRFSGSIFVVLSLLGGLWLASHASTMNEGYIGRGAYQTHLTRFPKLQLNLQENL